MSQVLKAVLNPVTNSIIFIYPGNVVAFCYDMFIYDFREESALQQFIDEFAGGGEGDAKLMSRDVDSYIYIHEPFDSYENEINHEAAVVVYTLENGFGIQ